MITTKQKLPGIRKIALKRPSGVGENWQGVPHGAFIAALESELYSYGYNVETVKAATSPDGSQLVASFVLDKYADDMRTCITLLTANDWRGSPKIVYGCVDQLGRGYAFDSFAMGRLHKEFDLPMRCAQAVQKIKATNIANANRIARFQKTVFGTEAATLMLTACARDTRTLAVKIPWANVAKTDELFHKVEDYTAWGLYRAFSEVTRGDPELKQVPRLLLFAERLSEAC